jgi:N-acetylglucosamine-6-phosphate deacetylase
MSKQAVLWINGTFYTPGKIIRNGSMLVNTEGKIESIGSNPIDSPPNTLVKDLKGRTILPGFIDIHVHGGDGFSVMNATFEDLNGMSIFHAKNGTTSFLATTTTSSREKTQNALDCAARSLKVGLNGADLLGVHLEGPFINEKRRGAQNKSEIRKPDLVELEDYLMASGNSIRLVTIASEVENGMKAVNYLADKGVTVSIGHSDATFQQVNEAVSNGVSHTTHHFNGMRPLHHREPGVAGAGLMLTELTTELIGDGIHVHPEVVKFLFETKGAGKVCMITDAVFCAGLPDGDYDSVTVSEGQVYLKDGSSLAGSSLTMIQALKNVMNFTGYSLEQILPSLTLVPARQIKVDEYKGSLEKGKDADFLIVDDELSILSTCVKGREVFSSEHEIESITN